MPAPLFTAAGHFDRDANLFDGRFPLPTAVLIEQSLQHNIELMSRYCSSHSVLLAPHGKTTMCEEIIRRQLAAGAWAITVATAWQAKVVATMGVRRILLANELVDRGSIRLIAGVLRDVPDLELYCYVDSNDGLALIIEGCPAELLARVRILVELGVQGGRTGLRADGDALLLGRRVAEGPSGLHGFAAFEGILDGGELDSTLGLVDGLIDRLESVATAAQRNGLYATHEPIVTLGGSAYFDRVVRRLPADLAGLGIRIVLRSGCYVTHDSGSYQKVSPLDQRSAGGDRLRPALEVWAAVLSRPEPGLAIVGLGRRDVSADAGLPIPRLIRSRSGVLTEPDPTWDTVAINDQHLYLRLSPDATLAVGDLIGFGISHPCTTFDKWRSIPLVDAEYTMTGVATTQF